MIPSEPLIEFVNMTMRFGDFKALDQVNLKIHPFRVHALLGENGAGKSTLVKCLIGFQSPSDGQIIVGNHEIDFKNPRDAHEAGLGMVFQQFALAENMTVAENFILSRDPVPLIINWKHEIQVLQEFMKTAPFSLPLQVAVNTLSAGQKQKLEILKQLFFKRPILILDEPTSVLTPQEADEILNLLKDMVKRKELTLILITHKFREVAAYADDVTVLRRGKLVFSGLANLSKEELGMMMVGEETINRIEKETFKGEHKTVLEIKNLKAVSPGEGHGIQGLSLHVDSGEILGVAGVSGNGQKELMEVLSGQLPYTAEVLQIQGEDYRAQRDFFQAKGVRLIPELPLQNACAGSMSVADNLAFQAFDHSPIGTKWGYSKKKLMDHAQSLQSQFGIRAASLEDPISTLSGGNVQRVVLARELSTQTNFLGVSNPCFGLDFKATQEIRARLMETRNTGAAVLLISEDLDELLELADRIVVMFEGAVVYEISGATATIPVLGKHMAGGTGD